MYKIECKFPPHVTPKLSEFIATKLLAAEDTMEVDDTFIEKCAMNMVSTGVLKLCHLSIQQIPKEQIAEEEVGRKIGVRTKQLEHKNVFLCRIRSAIGDLKTMGFVEYSDKIISRIKPVEQYEETKRLWLEAKENRKHKVPEAKPKKKPTLDEEEKARFAEWLKFNEMHEAATSVKPD